LRHDGSRRVVNIRVRLFASFREAAGHGEVPLDIAPGATVADVWRAVAERHEGLEGRAGATPVAAVNRSVVAESTKVAPGDEVAFLPPVSGG
jgi:molybdopterin converting factor subunit 1